MGQKSGQFMRIIGRLFRERQIYHRSDGVVRFIKLDVRTQIGLATVAFLAVSWTAYASVNFVFTEQIKVADAQDRRNTEKAYQSRLIESENAYDEINTLNVIFAQEFDAAISQLENRHETLRAIVERKRAQDDQFETLAATLASTGDPSGNKITNGNRVMVDAVGREPTPRQSRESRIRGEALQEVLSTEITAGLENTILKDMRSETAKLSAKQIVLMAKVESQARGRIKEIAKILEHTGVNTDFVVMKARLREENLASTSIDLFYGQGGPDISPENFTGKPSIYFQSANRIADTMRELNVLNEALKTVPLSGPLATPHRLTSPYGLRWNPTNRRKRQGHDGMDMAAAWNSNILATAPGQISFAGVRRGYGRTVEIDHGNGFMTRYAHLNRIKVKLGQKVNLHDTVGLLGNSGRSTGPHVHYEIRYKGKSFDPQRFIEAGRYVFES